MFTTPITNPTTSAPTRAGRPTLPTSFTAAELELMTLPEPEFVLPGLLPVGLSMLVAKPKAGKSWLSLNLALAATTGTEFLGRQLHQSDVLYLSLEDNPQRLLTLSA